MDFLDGVGLESMEIDNLDQFIPQYVLVDVYLGDKDFIMEFQVSYFRIFLENALETWNLPQN